MTLIGDYTFSKCSFTHFNILQTVTNIEVGSFSDCSLLTQINIPISFNEISPYLFLYCKSLKQITFENLCSIKMIGNYSFACCSSLEHIKIPLSVTFIKWYAFINCSSLTEITIPSSVECIENDAFSD